MADGDLTARAQALAEELFATALETDGCDAVPLHNLDRIADAGLYGLVVPTELGGLAADRHTVTAVVEALASGCLTTTFVWMQHHQSARMTSVAKAPIRDRWAAAMARGDVRSGVAFAHLRRPGPAVLEAHETDRGWVVNGSAPWVSGWGRIDVFLVGARDGDDVGWLLVDAVAGPGIAVEPVALAALAASSTVVVTFEDFVVSADRLIHREPFVEWRERDGRELRVNGSLALGVTRRACALLGASAFDGQLRAARQQLDDASPSELATARAMATDLAVCATAALVAAGAGRAITLGHHAQRLAREALFLLVQGQTPEIRSEQIRLLGSGRHGR